MNKKLLIKKIISATLAAALITSITVSAGAAVVDEKICVGSPLGETEISKAVESGKIVFDTSSGLQPALNEVKGSVLSPSCALPVSYKSETTAVKDQGSLGTCWAFATMGGLETFLLKDSKGVHDLSEQHLAWWATSQYNSNGYGWRYDGIDNGAPLLTGLGYLTSWEGPKTEEEIPYNGYGQNTMPDNMDTTSSTYRVTGAIYLEKDITSVKAAIMEYGSVVTSFNCAGYFNSDSTAFCYPPVDVSDIYNLDNPIFVSGHAILLVGWDDNYPKENFNSAYQPVNDGAWLVKNSWGENACENGYFWLSYEDGFLFMDELFGPSYAITEARTVNEYTKLYQNEEYGATDDIGIYNGYDGIYYRNITYINRFNFDSEHNILDEVVFETQSEGAKYSVYYIPIENDIPTTDTAKWTLLGDGTVDYCGYINYKVGNFNIPAGDGAIGVTIDTSELETPALIGVNDYAKNSSDGFDFLPETERGESYFILNGEISDIVDRYDQISDTYRGAFAIKVIATSNLIGDTTLDGKITTMDAFDALKISVDTISADNTAMINADVNYDGKITALDAFTIQKKAVGAISAF